MTIFEYREMHRPRWRHGAASRAVTARQGGEQEQGGEESPDLGGHSRVCGVLHRHLPLAVVLQETAVTARIPTCGVHHAVHSAQLLEGCRSRDMMQQSQR